VAGSSPWRSARHQLLVIRGADLTRLMVTLGIALLLEALAERFSGVTGGTDGLQGIEMQPILGLFASTCSARSASSTASRCCFCLFLLAGGSCTRRSGLSLRAIRNNPLARRRRRIPVNQAVDRHLHPGAFYAGSPVRCSPRARRWPRSTCSRSSARPISCWLL